MKHPAGGKAKGVLPAPGKAYGLELPAEPESLPVLRAFAEAIALEGGFEERARNHIQLALEEIAVNILMHGSGLGSDFRIRAILGPGLIRWEILDTGKPFAFDQAASRYEGIPTVEQPVGGLGLFLVKKVMDEVHYEPATPLGNRIILIKYKETS